LIALPDTDLALLGPLDMLYNLLPSDGFLKAWAGLERKDKAWQCTQQPGELVHGARMHLITRVASITWFEFEDLV
jgi:hypothetical protein